MMIHLISLVNGKTTFTLQLGLRLFNIFNVDPGKTAMWKTIPQHCIPSYPGGRDMCMSKHSITVCSHYSHLVEPEYIWVNYPDTLPVT